VSACPTQALAVFDPKAARDVMAGRRLQAAQQATAGEARP
jgi:Fe-S-cluster-containing hydrogenase component 2